MNHACLSCDARVDFATQTLETAGAGRYRHTDWRDCQTALTWTRPGLLTGWAAAKNDDVRVARGAGGLEPGDDLSVGHSVTVVVRRW